MFKLIDKEKITILGCKILPKWTYVSVPFENDVRNFSFSTVIPLYNKGSRIPQVFHNCSKYYVNKRTARNQKACNDLESIHSLMMLISDNSVGS